MNWYKIATRNIYQAVSRKLTTYIFERFKYHGTDEEEYTIPLRDIKDIVEGVADKDFLWDNLSEITVKYIFKDLDYGHDINIAAAMSNFSSMHIQTNIDLVIANTKIESIYEKFYYELYSTINHELEHASQDFMARKNNADREDYYRSEGGQNLYEILNNFKHYLFQQVEVEAFAIGVYRKAIAQKRNPMEVIKEYAYQILPSPADVRMRLLMDGESHRQQEISQMIDSIAMEFTNKMTSYLSTRFPDFRT